MSEQSTRLGLPYLVAAQAQKHLTVNESLLRLDALVQLSALSASEDAEPASPDDGDIYILPAGKTGDAWGDMAEGALAYYRDGVWEELTPRAGWRVYVEDEEALYARAAAGWSRIAGDGERRFVFTPGGDGVVSIYRIDASRAQNPRTATIGSVAGDIVTLAAADAGLFFGSAMTGVAYVRIWNTSKTPDQSAWVKAAPAGDQLQVLDAAAIASWSNGETIQIGDPTDQTPNRVIALDVSPMMQAVLGRVFRQAGVLLKAFAQSSASVQASIDASENGVSGTFHGVKSFTDGALQSGQFMSPCSVASPVSQSNLVFLRETVSTTLNIVGVSVLGFYV